jgi:hypothetical protein
VYVFVILAVEVSYGTVAYGADKGVGVGGTTAEKSSGEMIDESRIGRMFKVACRYGIGVRLG